MVSVTVEAIGPGRGPLQLGPDESRCVNLNDDVVYRSLRLGPLHQFHSGYPRSLIRDYDRLHDRPPFFLISKHSLNEVILP